jgi:hypothetical protein
MQYVLNVRLRGFQRRLGCCAKERNLVAFPGTEPRLSGLLGRGVDAPKVTLRALNASNINRSKRKKTIRHESAWGSAVKLHGILTPRNTNVPGKKKLLRRQVSV